MMKTPVASISRREFLGRSAGVVVLGMAPSGAWAASAEPALTMAILERSLAAARFPGAVAALGGDFDEPTFVSRGVIAFDSDRLAGPDTLWRIFSMTKPVTGMAAMLLIGEGRLRLDQPVAEFIPAFGDLRVLTDPAGLQSRPAKVKLTVRHLLTHTGGFGYAGQMPEPLTAAYLRLGLNPGRGGEAGPSSSPPIAPSLAEFADRLATLPLLSEPGARWNYSLGIDLLGRVIEIASGQPFDLFLQQRFFDPLEMRSTGFAVSTHDAAQLAGNYRRDGDKLALVDPGPTSVFLEKPPFPFGGSGLVSTARDYDHFLAMLAHKGIYKGRRIMPADVVAAGLSNLLPAGVDFQPYRALMRIDTDGFGAGGSVTLSGPGAGEYGWSGLAGTVARVSPERGWRGAGYINVINEYGLLASLPPAFRQDSEIA